MRSTRRILGARARAGVHFFSPAHKYGDTVMSDEMRQPRETRTTQISFHLLNKPRHTAPLSHGSRVAPTRHILRTRSTPDADPHQTDAHTLCTIRADADSGCRQRRPQQLRIAVAWRVAQARHTCHTGPTSGDANWSSRRDACTRHIVAACAARSCLRPSACGGR